MLSRKILQTFQVINNTSRLFSTSDINAAKYSCRLLVIGGGTGGCTIAAKFSNDFNQNEIIILEPAQRHYYQPLFTLVGGGINTLKDSYRSMGEVLPKTALWLKTRAIEFNPESNTVFAENGDVIEYEYLFIAMGLQCNYDQIPGLEEALSIPGGGVCSNYSAKYVNRTYTALRNFKSGNAIFTFPNTPVKCPGAPQKIMYIAEHYFRKHHKRENANIVYNTSLGVLFGVKRYADALWKICNERYIRVNLRTNLIEIIPCEKLAIFENLDKPEEIYSVKYEMLHVTPPMSAPDILRKQKHLVNDAGFLDVKKKTLQHTKYSNIFGIGDCTNSPNSKTAASIAAQSVVLYKNLKLTMLGKDPEFEFTGYASCPLVTGYNSCIMAEFDYSLTPLETFPFDQGKERLSMYLIKRDIMPPLYWNLMLNGYWNGPSFFRKVMHPFEKKK